mmetsp:Transcript_27620/g.68843  ORF Transcript_27620/g.68843 Transcript_27620/m.68843 type:complete len:1504 (-) Transcript_27620:594-5105(-)
MPVAPYLLAIGERERSLCLIKPDLIAGQKGCEVVARLEEDDFEIKQKKIAYLTKGDVEALFTDYHGRSDYSQRVAFMTSGPVWVLVVEHLEGDTVNRLAALAGPNDPQVADETTLRGQYGHDEVRNGVHVSADKWAAVRERDFFFPYLCECPTERTFGMVKPDATSHAGEILDTIGKENLLAVGMCELKLSAAQAEELYTEHKGKPFYDGLMSFITEEAGIIALCLEGRGAIERWRQLCGPTDPDTARTIAPWTLRARFGTDATRNAVHGSDCPASAAHELNIFFPKGTLPLERTLAIIKPDAVQKGHTDAILRRIKSSGFAVLTQKKLLLTRSRAEEFYAEHRDSAFFPSLVEFMCSGPVITLVLGRTGAVQVWRQLMGPTDSVQARESRPKSMRALYGADRQANAVHGSDSAKSADREIAFFFPELSADPLPSEGAIKDYIFRKSAKAGSASIDLSRGSIREMSQIDPTLQQILAKGLLGLCKIRPKGLDAAKWLADWMDQNNPSRVQVRAPPATATGPTSVVPASQPPMEGRGQTSVYVGCQKTMDEPKPEVVEVDVSAERLTDESEFEGQPPFIVFVLGGPGCGKGTQCGMIQRDFNFVHLSAGDLLREEVASGSPLGSEIEGHMLHGTLVPASVTISLIRTAILHPANRQINRFLIDGFPRAIEQAEQFERDVYSHAFTLFFDCSAEVMMARLLERSQTSGRVDDNEESVRKRLETYQTQTLPVIQHFQRIGKVRRVDASDGVDEVYRTTMQLFRPQLLYLLGGLGACTTALAQRLAETYRYFHVDAEKLVVQSEEISAHRKTSNGKRVVPLSMKALPPSVICPLVEENIKRALARGHTRFVLTGFPQTLPQMQFIEDKIHCGSVGYRMCMPRSALRTLALSPIDKHIPKEPTEASIRGVEKQLALFFSTEMRGVTDELKSRGNLRDVLCEDIFVSPMTLQESVDKLSCSLSPATDVQAPLWCRLQTATRPEVVFVHANGTSVSEKSLTDISQAITDLLGGERRGVVCSDIMAYMQIEANLPTPLGRKLRNARSNATDSRDAFATHALEAAQQLASVTNSSTLVLVNFPFNHKDEKHAVELLSIFNVNRLVLIGEPSCCPTGPSAEPDPILTEFARQGKLEHIPQKENEEEMFKDVIDRFAAKLLLVQAPPAFPIADVVSCLADKLALTPLPPTDVLLKEVMDLGGPLGDALKEHQTRTSSLTADALSPELLAQSLDAWLVMQPSGIGAFMAANLIGVAEQVEALEGVRVKAMGLMELTAPSEALAERAQEAGGDAFSAEDFEQAVNQYKERMDAITKLFAGRNAHYVVDATGFPPPWDLAQSLLDRSKFRSSILVVPPLQGLSDVVASKVAFESGCHLRYLDATELCHKRRQGCSGELDHQLYLSKLVQQQDMRPSPSSFVSDMCDWVPRSLWAPLLKSAMQQDFTKEYLITNLPTPTGMAGSTATVRDQYDAICYTANVEGLPKRGACSVLAGGVFLVLTVCTFRSVHILVHRPCS